ncbi:RtcB family protein [Xanthovirga aplysinae]|uniref:RtcB family protein n=1 Tax=Xanthovirga aplysinae TaxID=2529853 RepID=UPI0012BB9069|nr:RtcB family protein [Xanthovirga aplysinae]MTI33171.1 RtcB family protein [Xanthovirga aplysinae]
MTKTKFSGKDLLKVGIHQGPIMATILEILEDKYKYESKLEKRKLLKKLVKDPEAFSSDPIWAQVSLALQVEEKEEEELEEKKLKKQPANFTVFGADFIEREAYEQMVEAMRLPISVTGALMPDAHLGYGLPIGGVLAADNAVIPFGVGVDIGCRMCLSVFDLPKKWLDKHEDDLKSILLKNTRFGTGCIFEDPMDDPIFERKEFKEIPKVKEFRDRAYQQIGTSGGGNHFVDFGLVEIKNPENELNLAPGVYFSVLSHSGSRGLGAGLANYYTKIAMDICPLPRHSKSLAWLNLNSQVGQEYWMAMNLAGDYASASHHQIHKRISKAISEKPIARVENHHNFAWKEKLASGQEVIIHRKGATPALKGVLGIIPGSMSTPGFIIRGKGEENSLCSCAHGAGRVLSRRAAKRTLKPSQMIENLEKHHITLLGGGLDEAPMVYKDIDAVMKAQNELVEVIAVFHPRIVRMA